MQDLRERRFILQGIMGVVLLVMAARLFYLQVLSPDFAAKADENVIKRIVLDAQRGVIYDRSGEIYVTNSPIFDLNIVPRDLYIPDTHKLASFLRLPPEELDRRITLAAKHNRDKTQPLATQINADVYAALQEHLYATRGISTMVRNSRHYLYPVGANFLGYISEVDKKDIERSSGYYSQGDQIGRSGLERHYEDLLRGKKGVRMVMVDVHGREVGPFSEGKFDTIPEKGQDIMISIDARLQMLGEALMMNKVGSVVAIEPKSGEVLAFVSAPTYDPNQLTGMEYSTQWKVLVKDSLKPLVNRPLQGMYPPGSIFKLLNGIVALNAGTLVPSTTYGCALGFLRNGGRPACHAHPSPLALQGAVQHSCNAYFASVYVDMLHSNRFDTFDDAFTYWHDALSRFGVGHRVGLDIPNEKAGKLPNEAFYDKWYGANRWKAMTIVSNAIGQGEVLMTPLQMANTVAAIANRGYYVQPHFLRGYVGESRRRLPHFDTVRTNIPEEHFRVVIDGMEQVVQAGTAYYYGRVPGIAIAGKTGTAENPHGQDHSVYVAFAPKDDPKIAIAVIVENGGYGGNWANPIAALMIEQYLTGKITDKGRLDRVLNADFIRKPPKDKWPVKAPTPSDKRGMIIRQAALNLIGPAEPESKAKPVLAAQPAPQPAPTAQTLPRRGRLDSVAPVAPRMQQARMGSTGRRPLRAKPDLIPPAELPATLAGATAEAESPDS